MLWAIYSGYAVERVAQACGKKLVKTGITAYADDFQVAWDILQPQDADTFRTLASIMFHTLESQF